MGSIIWDEDGQVVGWAEAGQAGTVVAAIGVVAGGVLPTDLTGTYLALIFIWKKTFLLHLGESELKALMSFISVAFLTLTSQDLFCEEGL